MNSNSESYDTNVPSIVEISSDETVAKTEAALNDVALNDVASGTVPQVSVIVVSYNTRDMTLCCLETLLEKSAGVSLDVWVVDNASKDGSARAIAERFPTVKIIESVDNNGFGAANNKAMQQARGEFLLLLNSDAFVHAGALQTLIEYSKSRPEVGVVGPRLLNKDGSLQHSCFRFPGPLFVWSDNLWLASLLPTTSRWSNLRHWPHDAEREVDCVSGACMLVRRRAMEQSGAFDEHFFMYFEEIDWQRRMAKLGWKIAFLPQAVVTHWGGASGGVESARISESFFDSLDFYEWKHHGIAGLASVRAAMTIGCALRALLWTLAAAIPSKRKTARAKVKLQLWLALRQLTRWKVPLKNQAKSA